MKTGPLPAFREQFDDAPQYQRAGDIET